MNSLSLEFYGIKIVIRTGDLESEPVIHWLEEDFLHFKVEENGSAPKSVFDLKIGQSEILSLNSFPLFKTRMCKAYGLGAARICDFGGGNTVYSSDGPVRKFKVFGSDVAMLYEMTFMALLSVAGEYLDKDGFHRVHALGLNINGNGILITLPQGGGKSALATLIAQRKDVKIFSDETPLLHRGKLYSFPLRIALRPEVARALKIKKSGREFLRKIFDTKELFPFPARKLSGPAPLNYILAGEKTENKPGIEQASKAVGLAALGRNMVVGIGVPQMAEYMLRFSGAASLAGIALKRSKEASRSLIRTRTFRFQVCKDAFKNAQCLEKFLDSIPFENSQH